MIARRQRQRSGLASLEDGLAMLLQGMQASLQSMQHREGAIYLPPGLSQFLYDPFLPSNTLLDEREVSLGLGNAVLSVGLAHTNSIFAARSCNLI
jgi:hypothetical protein